jgi:hypothetical protein
MANTKTVNNIDAPVVEWTDPGHEEAKGTCVDCGIWDKDFRRHFMDTYALNGGEYGQYSDAYEFGHRLGHGGISEGDLRGEWEKRKPGSWDTFKDAVRYGWDKGRSR